MTNQECHGLHARKEAGVWRTLSPRRRSSATRASAPAGSGVRLASSSSTGFSAHPSTTTAQRPPPLPPLRLTVPSRPLNSYSMGHVSDASRTCPGRVQCLAVDRLRRQPAELHAAARPKAASPLLRPPRRPVAPRRPPPRPSREERVERGADGADAGRLRPLGELEAAVRSVDLDEGEAGGGRTCSDGALDRLGRRDRPAARAGEEERAVAGWKLAELWRLRARSLDDKINKIK